MHADRDPLSDELVQAVDSLAEAFAARSIRHALIGGLATMMRGRPRFTQDVDFLMVAFRAQDQADIETLLTGNRDRIDIDLIREEWSPFAATEPERTAWLEATIARRVDRRE